VITRRTSFLLIILVAMAVLVGVPHVRGKNTALNASKPTAGNTPALINTCLITRNVPRLVGFYRQVLGIDPRTVSDSYAEFSTGVGVLAIFSADAQEKYIPHSAEPASNKSAILQFRVADPDQEYSRLQPIVKTWVKPPTTQPWGTRSIYFRDPDGNLVDFFTLIKRQ
jgi:catechol 2,3-dioxygenase-like lactoylglutathione lyase family enzyme